jgi:hypothetical protein
MTAIVGVHGVGQHVPGVAVTELAAGLTNSWAAALGLGDAGTELTVAYYAHHLRSGVPQGAEDLESLDDEACELLYRWACELAGSQPVPQGWLLAPVRDIIAMMAGGPYRGLPLRAFVTVFMREVQLYLGRRHGDRRLRAREEVAAHIRERGASIVVAHSLGSVVAYEALHAHPDLEVDLLVTIGSPLAIRGTVFDRLLPAPGTAGGRAPRPPGVRRWANVADPGDICAVPRWLGRYFDVTDDTEAPIGTFAYHKATAYLTCDRVRALIHRSLRPGSHGG